MPYAQVNGCKIYYELHGEGDTVVLLNGILASTQSWANQVSFFAKKFQVLLMDFRGQAKSEKPTIKYPMTLHADDVRALLDSLKFKRAHFVGVSFGAEVALIFAARYPEMVKSLVAACAVSHVDSVVRSVAERWLVAARLRSGKYLFQTVYPDLFSDRFIRENRDFINSTAPFYDTTVDIDAFIELLRGFLQLNVTSDLPKIKAPTLVIAAENDRIKSRRYAEIIHKGIAGSKLHEVKDSGHTVVWEKPEEFNKLVCDFIVSNS
jgi:pimeloyl-ACP methyl ester carboxylesterase